MSLIRLEITDSLIHVPGPKADLFLGRASISDIDVTERCDTMT